MNLDETQTQHTAEGSDNGAGGDDSNFHDSTDFEGEAKKRCCWCKRIVQLLKRQKHCQMCQDNAYKLCCRCKIPYPSVKFFSLHSQRCDPCERRYRKEKARREMKKTATIIENNDSSDDEQPNKKKSKITALKANQKKTPKTITNKKTIAKSSINNLTTKTVAKFAEGCPEGFSMRWVMLPIMVSDQDEK